MRVIVVGGGVMGCAAALRLAEQGAEVVVLERAIPGAEASSAAAGILGPAIEAHAPGLGLTLGLESRERHAVLAAELRETHGIDVGFRRSGVLRVAFDTRDAEDLAAQARMLAAEGVRVHVLDPAEALALEPALANDLVAAMELPDEAQLEPRLLLRALAVASERAGVEFRTGETVRGLLLENDAARGVRTDTGRVEGDAVVVAAGSWTSLVPGLGIAPDAIFPVRGQLFEATTRAPLLRRIVFGAGGYVVPRPDGRVISGSTMEHVGFAREVTVSGLASLLTRATRIVPALGDASLAGHWSSFRPGTKDGLPLIGALGPRGLYVASGHHRNGILLSALTAELVRDLVLGVPRPSLEALDPRRFEVA